jgi:hypothetical protein
MNEMGCDAYCDENGEFEITIFSYDEPRDMKKIQHVYGSGFEPNERLQIDLNKGEWR